MAAHFGRVARVASWEGPFGTLRWYSKLGFAERRTASFSSKGQVIGYAVRYCGTSLFSRSPKETAGSCEPSKLYGTRLWNCEGRTNG